MFTMENISNFPCSAFSSLQNDCEMMQRDSLPQEIDNEHTFGSDLKKRARQTAIRSGAGKIQKNQKLSSSKLNVSLRTFGNSIKTDLITKVSNLGDDSAKSLCEKDILKLLEMTQQPQSAAGVGGPKSIFRDIEEQYTQIVPSLASEDIENCSPIGGEEVSFNDQQLRNLIRHKLYSAGPSTTSTATLMNATLTHVPSVQSLLEPEMQRLANTHAGVNQVLAWEEMRQQLPEGATSDAYLRRNFRARCNQLSAAQGRASPPLASRSAATAALQEVQNFCEEHERQERHVQQRRLLNNAPDSSPGSPEEPSSMAPRCRTPEATFRIFPETSYHTPENQRFSGEDLSARSTSRYQAGIFLVPDDYNVSRGLGGGDAPDCAQPRPVLYELQQTDDCSLDTDLNKNLMRQLGISVSEQTRFFGMNDFQQMETMAQKRSAPHAALNIEESHPLDNDLNETFLLLTQRPKKHLRLSDARVHTLSASKDNSPDLPVLDALNFSRSVSPKRRKFVPRRKLHYVGQQLMEAEQHAVVGDCRPLFGGKGKLEEAVRSPFPRPVYTAADGRQLKLQFNMQVQKKSAPARPAERPPIFYSPNEYALRKRYAPHTLPAASEPAPSGAGPSHCEDMPQPGSPAKLKFFPRLQR